MEEQMYSLTHNSYPAWSGAREHEEGGKGYDGGVKGVKVEEEKYGCKERGKVTFMPQQRADTSSPWLRKATEVLW